ncbi:MAG: Ppx/GppA family phosphatase [Myxococcales bacterium]|nr:Ppx/GppA family phosphatase [Myxococcales bacterium]
MTMRIATVDVGTNTALLLIVERQGRELCEIGNEAEIVRLGQGVDRTRRLDPQAIERTLAVLRRYGELIRAARVDRAAAVGTQALREVENGAEFLARAEEALGFPVEVIAGQREARLSWRAVASSFPLPPSGRRTVLDIGGGSTELLVGGDEVERLASVPIGAVRLTERLLHHDPPSDEERRLLVDTIDRALDAAPAPEGELVGVAGTITTLCAISLGLLAYDGARIQGARLRRGDVEREVERLGALSLEDRKRIPGLDPKRADVIYAGGMILARIFARADADEVLVSDRGIRWGLAHELAALE